MECAVELDVGDRLLLIGDVDLGERLVGLIFKSHADAAVKGAAIGIDIDGGINGGDFGLEEVFVLFKLAFVVGLDVAACFGIEILVEDVSVVEIPSTGAGGDDGEEQRKRGKPGCEQKRLAGAGAERVLGSAARQCDGDDAEDSRDREPVDDRPEQGRNEVTVAVHVGVDIGGSLADEVEGVLPAKAVEDGHEDKEPDQDGIADKLVRNHGLNEEGKKGEGDYLREGHDVELFDVLKEFVVVVTEERLHQNADEHSEGEEDDLDDQDGGEAGEPVGGLAHGQRVMDAVEVSIALAPEEFRGIETRDNEEEKQGAALDGLDHQVRDRPDVLLSDAASEITVVNPEGEEQGDEGPEWYVTKDIAQAEAG